MTGGQFINGSLGHSWLGGGFSPLSIPNLMYWYDASSNANVYADGAAQFVAANNSILILADPSTLEPGSGNFEIGGWFYADSVAGIQGIIGKWDTNSLREYVLYLDTTTPHFSVSNDGSAITDVASTVTVSASTWYSFRCWYDGSKIYISINNQATPDSTSYSSSIYNGTAAFAIGGYYVAGATGAQFSGRIDSCYYSPIISTTTQATSLYNSGNGRIYADLTLANSLDGIKSNITSWWDCWEEEGFRYDSKGSNHLAESSTTIIGANGGIGASLVQDGNFGATFNGSSWLTVADNSTLRVGGTSWTIAGWANVTALAANQHLWGKGTLGDGACEYAVTVTNTTGYVRADFMTSGGITNVTTSSLTGLVPGDWYFICVRYDSSAKKGYVSINNGTEVLGTVSGIVDNTNAFTVAQSSLGTYPTTGTIDNLGLWKRSLSSAERTTLFNLGRGVQFSELSSAMKASLVSWWEMEESSGNRADSYGTNTLTVGGGAPTRGHGINWYGGAVGKLIDRSPNARHLTQSVGSKRPLWQRGTSFGYITFDAVDDYLRTAAFAVSQPFTIIVVKRFPSVPAANIYSIDGLTLNHGGMLVNSAGAQYMNSGSFFTSGSPTPGSFYIFSGTYNGASSSGSINNAAPTSGNAGANAIDGLTVGCSASLANFWTGDIAEIIGVAASSVSTAVQYLAGKYGITIS